MKKNVNDQIVIEVNDLKKSFNGNVVLENINFKLYTVLIIICFNFTSFIVLREKNS